MRRQPLNDRIGAGPSKTQAQQTPQNMPYFQNNLVTDCYMNLLIQKVRQTQRTQKESSKQEEGDKEGEENDQYFDHDYEDEEQLCAVLQAYYNIGGDLNQVKRLIQDFNQ